MSFTPYHRWLRRSCGFFLAKGAFPIELLIVELLLVELDAGIFDDLRPARLLGPEPLPERLGGSGPRLGSLLGEALLHVFGREDFGELGIQLRNDFARNARRADHALERSGLEACKA